MDDVEDAPDEKYFRAFDKYGEFANTQRSCLILDLLEMPSEEEDKKEQVLFKKLFDILDEYQEQSYLLDSYLEDLVTPVVNSLRSYAKISVSNRLRGSPSRIERLSTLLYSYMKCRGYKTITRFFPHEVTDLSIVLDFFTTPDGVINAPSQWTLRYIILIWLSLICMIPFDLAQFDEDGHPGHTESRLEDSAKSLIGKPGIEREGAALLLSRLYIRRDTGSQFQLFLTWCQSYLGSENSDIFMSIGLLQVLCGVAKSGPIGQTTQLDGLVDTIEKTQTLSTNTVFRKYKTKFIVRIALRLLPAGPLHRWLPGRTLGGSVIAEPANLEIDVPTEVEDILGRLFLVIQDKDTIVRWTAAKGVARIAERIPLDFADQVLETVLGLFSIHTIAAASLYDIPAIAEATWHGACLACAELARRGVIIEERLPQLVEWMSKALYFDLRKGSHSIGSNVRDAAAYVLWALARTQEPSSLAPHAQSLAKCLSTVALFDREIHVRRAASAAFQEHVGRNNLFPHGIDVLRKTDFYAIGVRRSAFLTAAPQVSEHLGYRIFLLHHILDVTIRHWDPGMRELGSQSLRLICLTDLSILGVEVVKKSIKLLDSLDLADLHGALLALSEIAIAYRDHDEYPSREARLHEIFQCLARIPVDVLVGPRNVAITATACHLISITLQISDIAERSASTFNWEKIVEHGLKHHNPLVQKAAANAVRSMSRLELRNSPPTIQQSLGTLLGAIDYSAYPNALPEAISCVTEFVKPSLALKYDIEARRNCYIAISDIISTVSANISQYFSAETVRILFEILLSGLDDYTIDQRGDVGSWIRIACVQSLATVSEVLVQRASSLSPFDAFLPPSKFHSAVSGILKQGVERLDNVRQEAGGCFLRLLRLESPAVPNAKSWELPGLPLLQSLFGSENVGWNDASWLFPRAVRLLGIPEYRYDVLMGLVFGVSTKTDSTQRHLVASLVSYIKSLPPTHERDLDVYTILGDLITRAKPNLSSNSIIIPILQTLTVLIEGGALDGLKHDSHGIENLRQVLSIAIRNVSRLKSVPRINESMKITVNLLSFASLRETCRLKMGGFLGHNFPTVRSSTAEYLYLFLQGADLGRDTEEAEDLLLETAWSSDMEPVKEVTDRVVTLLSEKE